MKRLILLLSLFSATIALGVDTKPIGNPVSGGATSFFSNIGGTITTVGGISNPGSFTLGAASGTQTHIVKGDAVTLQSANGPFLNLWVSPAGNNGAIEQSGNDLYLGTSSSSGSVYIKKGFTGLGKPSTSGGSTIMSSSSTGAWEIGPANCSDTHNFNGSTLPTLNAGVRTEAGLANIGLYGTGNGTGTVSCTTLCDAGKASHGIATGTTSICLGAWNHDAGAVLTCADTSSVARICLCVGRKG